MGENQSYSKVSDVRPCIDHSEAAALLPTLRRLLPLKRRSRKAPDTEGRSSDLMTSRYVMTPIQSCRGAKCGVARPRALAPPADADRLKMRAAQMASSEIRRHNNTSEQVTAVSPYPLAIVIVTLSFCVTSRECRARNFPFSIRRYEELGRSSIFVSPVAQ